MRKKVKGWMICSYFFVLAIFILIYLAIQQQTERKIRELYMERQLAVMNQTMLAVDEQVEAVTKLCLALIQEPYVQYFPFVGTELNRYDRENATKLLQNIRKHYTDDPFVEDFYIFFENSGRIANANGFYPEDAFYEMEWSYEDQELHRQAREYLRQGGTFFMPSAWMANGAKRTKNITFFYEIGNHSQNRSGKSAKLVVLLKEEWLDSMIMPMSRNGKTSIRGAYDGEELYCFYGGEFPRDILADKDRLLTTLDSEKTGWIYESVIPYRIIIDQTKESVKPMSIGLFLYLLIGIPACFLMAIWNYTPIHQLTAHVESTGFGEKAGNEIEFIRSGIVNLHRKYEELELKYDSTLQEFDSASRKLKRNRERILEGTLLQLIGGYWGEDQETEERLQSLGIIFPYEKFCVATIDVETGREEQEILNANERSLRLFVLKNVAQEFLAPAGVVIPVPANSEQLFLVMNLSEAGYQGQRISAELEKLLMEMMEYFRKKIDIIISVGMGTLCAGIRQLNTSFQNSMRALEYCFILGRASLVIFDRIEETGRGTLVYDGGFEKKLLGSVRQRDTEEGIRLIDQLYQTALERRISVEEGRRLHMFLADMSMKAIEKFGVKGETAEICQDMVAGILNSRTLPEAFPVMKELFVVLCRRDEENGNEKERELERQIISDIQNHFCDPAFSLQMCAGHFGVSPEHLSRTIKLLTGRNFIDIVNGLRLEQAKWYLLETDKKMEEIAELSGYGTPKTFFRSFKQAEGMPPGVWRKEMKSLQ